MGTPGQGPSTTQLGGGFGVSGQLSQSFGTPSPSESTPPTPNFPGHGSQVSPTPSPSKSSWFGLGTVGQLSHASPMPSLSASAWFEFAQTAGSWVQAGCVFGLQLSTESRTPSSSASTKCVRMKLPLRSPLSQVGDHHRPSPSFSSSPNSPALNTPNWTSRLPASRKVMGPPESPGNGCATPPDVISTA